MARRTIEHRLPCIIVSNSMADCSSQHNINHSLHSMLPDWTFFPRFFFPSFLPSFPPPLLFLSLSLLFLLLVLLLFFCLLFFPSTTPLFHFAILLACLLSWIFCVALPRDTHVPSPSVVLFPLLSPLPNPSSLCPSFYLSLSLSLSFALPPPSLSLTTSISPSWRQY